MTADQNIDYEALAQDAMRGVVRAVMQRVHKNGLPGNHHFYIAFNTQAPGVVISPRLRQKYPEEMTIVMQHRFWDLQVTHERFEIKLTFDSIPERLVVPFDAVKVFFDPSVPYGLQFEESELASDANRQALGLDDEDRTMLEPVSLMPDTQSENGVTPLHSDDSEPAPAVRLPAKKRPVRRRTKVKPVEAAPAASGEDGSDVAGGESGEAKPTPRKKPELAPVGTDDNAPPEPVADEPLDVDAMEAADAAEEAAPDTDADAGAKVVQLDAFRKK